jgi:hypothetical protein
MGAEPFKKPSISSNPTVLNQQSNMMENIIFPLELPNIGDFPRQKNSTKL